MKKSDYDIDYKKICPEISEEIEDYLKKNDAMMKYREYERKRTKYINDIIVYAKEDSVERLIEAGVQFISPINTEDEISNKILLERLADALIKLPNTEKRLIEAVYYRDESIRQVSEIENNTS